MKFSKKLGNLFSQPYIFLHEKNEKKNLPFMSKIDQKFVGKVKHCRIVRFFFLELDGTFVFFFFFLKQVLTSGDL
jgi:hypothetical protein